MCSTIAYNVLTWYEAALTASMMDGYNIDFIAIIRREIHESSFSRMKSLPFLFLVQRLYDKVGIPEIPGINERVEALIMEHTKIMKDL